MARKYVRHSGQNYIFRRNVSDMEKETFEKHIGASAYYFKRLGTSWAFFVKNNSQGNSVSKYHSSLRRISNKYV